MRRNLTCSLLAATALALCACGNDDGYERNEAEILVDEKKAQETTLRSALDKIIQHSADEADYRPNMIKPTLSNRGESGVGYTVNGSYVKVVKRRGGIASVEARFKEGTVRVDNGSCVKVTMGYDTAIDCAVLAPDEWRLFSEAMQSLSGKHAARASDPIDRSSN